MAKFEAWTTRLGPKGEELIVALKDGICLKFLNDFNDFWNVPVVFITKNKHKAEKVDVSFYFDVDQLYGKQKWARISKKLKV